MAIAQFYIDDSNGSVYASQYSTETTGSSTNDRLVLGLDEIPTSTMSTWLINRIRFKFSGFYEQAIGNDAGPLSILCGISESSITDNLYSLGSYQDIKGWPLKGCFTTLASLGVSEESANIRSSWTKTWTPSRGNHLALNRLQNIQMAIHNHGTGIWESVLSISVEAKRGR